MPDLAKKPGKADDIPTADLIPDDWDRHSGAPPNAAASVWEEVASEAAAAPGHLDAGAVSAADVPLKPAATAAPAAVVKVGLKSMEATREKTKERADAPLKTDNVAQALVGFVLFWAVVLALVGGGYTGNRLVLYMAVVCAGAVGFSAYVFQKFLNFLGNSWLPSPFTRFTLNAGPCALLLVVAACYFSPQATDRLWVVGSRDTVKGGYLLAVPFLQDIRSVAATHQIEVPFVQLTVDKHVLTGIARTTIYMSSDSEAVRMLVQEHPDPDGYILNEAATGITQEVERFIGGSKALDLQAVTAIEVKQVDAEGAAENESVAGRRRESAEPFVWNKRIELEMQPALPLQPPRSWRSLPFLRQFREFLGFR